MVRPLDFFSETLPGVRLCSSRFQGPRAVQESVDKVYAK